MPLFRKTHVIKINLYGGIVSAGDMYAIVDAAAKAGVEEVQFGTRQQLYIRVEDHRLAGFTQALRQHNIQFEVNDDQYPNIISSYVTEEVFQNAHWLGEGLYKDILDLFDYKPQLKINIVDSSQTFIPFFTGNLNFIASTTGNYWHLYVRFPKSTITYAWKGLIYSHDIPRMSMIIEQVLYANKSLFSDKPAGDVLQEMVNASHHFITQQATEPLHLPEFQLPYYEGFNRYGDKYWLGIYRRDEMFPLAFLKDICIVCLKTKIGQLYTTPWKSLIIKGIDQPDRKFWDYTLGKYRINVRHASNELNWQISDLSEDGLNLKRYLIRQFDKEDVRTFGLCFAIKVAPKTGLFGSVIIQKIANDSANQRRALDRYDILFTTDFNPNSKEYVVFRKDVVKENLATYLISLCKYFYELRSKEELILHHAYRQETVKSHAEPTPVHPLFECKHCFTVYDKVYGDEINGIPPGTAFEQLPHYECPTCGASKEDFKLVERAGFYPIFAP